MAPIEEYSMTDLVNEVKDIEIEDDVQKDLGLDGQKLKTWADVHKLMLSVADQLEPSVVDRLKQKLRGVVQKKREGINKLHPRDNVENAIDNQEDNKYSIFHFAAEMLGADNVVEKNRVTAFIVEMMYKYDVSLKEVATAGGFQLEGPTTIDTPSRDISVPLSPDIAATPSRDWRDSRGNDAGLAVRQQYLNPPTDPWDDVVL